MDDYRKASAYLESLIHLDRDNEKRAAFARQKALLHVMGDPQKSFKSVHVGGTAGKGSTCMILAEILRRADYRAGLHVSPHLEDARERFQVNGKLTSTANYLKLIDYVKPFVEQVKRKYPYGWPSFFEVLVAVSFEHFKRERVDIAVVEVGMGGEFDGTNTIDPLVAILTNVGLDHTEYLGDTVEKIAGEKVGIFKRRIDVVSGVTQPSVIRIVRARAKSLNCRLHLLGKDIRYKLLRYGADSMVFDLRFGDEELKRLAIAASGEHQVANASLSVSAALLLRKRGFDISERAIRAALKGVSLPGRFEIVGRSPTVILDGAHNPMKMQAFVSTLRHTYRNRRFKVVFAAKKDKKLDEMLRTLGKVTDTFYFTKFIEAADFGKNMAYHPGELPRHTRNRSLVFERAIDAYRKAVRDAGKKGVVCVTGSLYLVGELRSRILAA